MTRNTNNSTTVIVKIKGKPRSLFCNKRTVIGKLTHIIIYNKNKYVELICENKDVLVNFTSWIYFLSLYIALNVCFPLFKMRSELFRVTPHQLDTDLILQDRKPMIEI
jgi:hypothetical protein